MKILILGYSKIFQSRVLPALQSIEKLNSIDIASNSNIVDISSINKGNKFYNNYETALLDSDARIVYVSTINSSHFHWVKRALECNFHVVVDKPAFLTFDETQIILNLAKEKGKCVSESLVYQYHPQLTAIDAIFKNHETKPRRILTSFSFPGLGIDNFRYQSQFGGGAVYDLSAYALSIGRFIFKSKATSIFAVKSFSNPDKTVETSFNLMMEYECGSTMIGFFGFDTEYTNKLEVFSENLSINVSRIYTTTPETVNVLLQKNKNVESQIVMPAGDSFKNYFERVFNDVENGQFDFHLKEIHENASLLDNLLKTLKNTKYEN